MIRRQMALAEGGGSYGAPQQAQPYVLITEQPASRALRFRYQCEGRYPGTLVGVNSTAENKTYPTIKVMNYTGKAAVVVSCVTKDQPYRVHPHNLVGKEGCKKGICTQYVKADMSCSFTSLGIQCVKRRDVEQSLLDRERIRVDPFHNGFDHKDQASSIDLNAVRLCFQVFLEDSSTGKFTMPLPPVVSEVIYDRKAMSDLAITKLSHTCAPVSGGQEMILLCDKVAKDDVEVWFEEGCEGQALWKERAEILPNGVHKQVAICFRSPCYRDPNVEHPVDIHLLLRRPSDGALSEPRPFTLHPKDRDPEAIERKRRKISEGYLDRYLQENMALGPMAPLAIAVPRIMRQAVRMQPRAETAPPQMSEGAATMQHIPPGAQALAPLTTAAVQYRDPRPSAAAQSSYEPQADAAEVIDTAEKLDSLDLGIDPSEMGLTSGELNMNIDPSIHLSASLFDSGNNLVEVQLDSGGATSRSLHRLQNEIDALNNLSGGPRMFKADPS